MSTGSLEVRPSVATLTLLRQASESSQEPNPYGQVQHDFVSTTQHLYRAPLNVELYLRIDAQELP